MSKSVREQQFEDRKKLHQKNAKPAPQKAEAVKPAEKKAWPKKK
tara:strand:- start:190 stop:321 length:132 start_codon:yes stop_codon:yes gene_type:complete